MISLEKYLSPVVRQAVVTLGPIIITIALGMVEGYSAILLPQLQTEDSILKIDYEEASWIASITALSMPFGCISGGILMEKYGRKFTHQLTCVPCLIGWILIYFSSNIGLLLFGRFLTGFSIGLLGPPTGVYISEISSPRYRGFFLALISFGIAFGIFLAHLIGTFLDWQLTALICASFPIIAFLAMIGTPESPNFHAKNAEYDKARRAFYWCRGSSEEAKNEIGIIIQRQKVIKTEDSKNLWEEIKELKKPEFYKPLLIIVAFFILIQWSGLNALAFYTVTIIEETIPGNINVYYAMLIVDTIRLIMSVVACVLLKKIGRRPLALISGFGTAISLMWISIYSFTTRFYPEFGVNHYYLAICGLVFYITFITIGFVPLPWTMMGEVFPSRNRGLGSGITSLMGYAACFSVVKTLPQMMQDLGMDGTFLVYCLVAFFGSIFLYFYLPETKDKALHNIEDNFKDSPDIQL